jgi:patatin-like phospholipase/acyl hydrolase
MKKILSIDGGGIRGVIPAVFLSEIEKRKNKPVSGLFDLIAGTSTGGILAACLAVPDESMPAAEGKKPKYSALNIIELYEKEGRKIFNKSPWKTVMSLGNLLDEKYSYEGIEEILKQYLGENKLTDCIVDIIATSYETEGRFPYFFKSMKARKEPGHNYLLREVARATSAAPTYFEPLKLHAVPPVDYYSLVDGGVYANNPAMCGYVESINKFGRNEEILLVSIGTGELTRRIAYEDAKNWGLAEWARPLLNVVFDGVSDTVDYQLKQLLPDVNGQKRYFRFQTTLDIGNDNMDDASLTNIRALKLKAEKMIEERSADIDALCAEL